MLYLLVISAVLAGLTLMVWKRAKLDTRLYAKVATIALAFLSVFYFYQFAYYTQIGNDIGRFAGGGSTGITYTNSLGNSTTFLSSTDVQVGEYLAQQKANADVITILSGIMPILAILLAGYLLWYYVEVGLYARDDERRVT